MTIPSLTDVDSFSAFWEVVLGGRVTASLSDSLDVSSGVVVFVEREHEAVIEREGSNGDAKSIVRMWMDNIGGIDLFVIIDGANVGICMFVHHDIVSQSDRSFDLKSFIR